MGDHHLIGPIPNLASLAGDRHGENGERFRALGLAKLMEYFQLVRLLTLRQNCDRFICHAAGDVFPQLTELSKKQTRHGKRNRFMCFLQ